MPGLNLERWVPPPSGTYRENALLAWLPIIIGLIILYAPTYANLASTLWASEEYSHGPVIASISFWLIFQLRKGLTSVLLAPKLALGGVTLVFGLLLLLAGRALEIPLLETASQIPVATGVLLLMRGPQALRTAWFPICFLLFMIPIPGIVMDTITAHLKEWISFLAEESLYILGFPVARQGVVINIGQYQLFVADACAGLYSMFSLSAMGALFIYLAKRLSLLHNIILVLSILPIAFIANLLRVMILLLITYHFGDSSARWLHDLAGVTVFLTALLMLSFFDRLLAFYCKRWKG